MYWKSEKKIRNGKDIHTISQMCRFVDIASKEKVNDIAGNTELA